MITSPTLLYLKATVRASSRPNVQTSSKKVVPGKNDSTTLRHLGSCSTLTCPAMGKPNTSHATLSAAIPSKRPTLKTWTWTKSCSSGKFPPSWAVDCTHAKTFSRFEAQSPPPSVDASEQVASPSTGVLKSI